MTPTERRQADRAAYHLHNRAAKAMQADADGFRAIAASATANPEQYGPDAKTYAEGIAARYEILAAWAEHMADRQREYAASYRAHLLEVVA